MTHNTRERIDEIKTALWELGHTAKDAGHIIEMIDSLIHQELQKAREEERESVKHEVIKLLAGNTPIFEKRKASAYNEGVTSGWYAAREFIRLELNAQQNQSELDQHTDSHQAGGADTSAIKLGIAENLTVKISGNGGSTIDLVDNQTP